jgi:hypothetical protein
LIVYLLFCQVSLRAMLTELGKRIVGFIICAGQAVIRLRAAASGQPGGLY